MIFIFISICVIIIATLYPFHFDFNQSLSVANFFASFNNATSLTDSINNVLLFMPLGFFIGDFISKKRFKLPYQILIVFLVGGSLSFMVEILQIFLPSRTPTPADIINNTWGSCLGLLIYHIYNFNLLNKSITNFKSSNFKLSKQQLSIFVFAYICLIFITFIPWKNTLNLSHWNVNFPLVIGNESTGNRPWEGSISSLLISDKAISNDEAKKVFLDPNYFHSFKKYLVANYQFNQQCCYEDKTGNLPQLIWQGKPKIIKKYEGVFINSQQWLKTATPVKNLSQRISKTSEFTIIVNLATDNFQQIGPARIISISSDVLRRNLTIGQKYDALELRLRTPLGGENGADLPMKIPGVFTDKEFHQIIITYSRGNVKVYKDNIQEFYSLHLLRVIPFYHKLFYYTISFIPVGASLAILNLLTNKQDIFARVLVVSGIFLPSLILEFVLIIESNKIFSFTNLFLGIFLTTATMFILMFRGRYISNRLVVTLTSRLQTLINSKF